MRKPVHGGAIRAFDVAFDDAQFGHVRLLSSSGLQRCIETRIDAARIAFVDLVAVFSAQVLRRLDVALRVVEMVPGLGIDAAHRADHLAGEQDVLDRNDLRQQIDAGLVIDAGVEEDVLEEVLAQQRLLERLREPAYRPQW